MPQKIHASGKTINLLRYYWTAQHSSTLTDQVKGFDTDFVSFLK